MKQRDSLLDLVRGVSALLVMLGHLRAFLFVDYGEVAGSGRLTKAFYFATGLGHQAVMVFFVLSGYLVGGSVIAGLRKGSFRWGGYAAARLVRLWMVLLPALLLTLGADLAGRHVNAAAYAGGLNSQFMSGPTVAEPASLDGLTFLGNLGFVQTIAVPVYGSNGPLWMLANMFWYYVLFPLLAVGIWQATRFVHGRRRNSGSPASRIPHPPSCIPHPASRILHPASCLLLFLFLVWWLPGELLSGGLVWLMGVGVWGAGTVVSRQLSVGSDCGQVLQRGVQGESPAPAGRRVDERSVGAETVGDGLTATGGMRRWIAWPARGWPLRVVGGLVFLGTLAASKTGHWLGSDYAVGGAFAAWMLSLPGAWQASGWVQRMVSGLAEISYTLYVVHFPVLFYIAAVVLRGRQFEPGVHGSAWFVVLAAGVLVLAAGMWWLFERNTGWVRKRVADAIGGGPSRREAA